MPTKRPVLFEMETSDPDDFMTLLWLADHPELSLEAVVVTPGSADQCQLVRWGLDLCGRKDVPVGSFHGRQWFDTDDGKKPRVSGFHYRVYGEDIQQYPLGTIEHGPTLIVSTLVKHPTLTVIVGSAPKNLGKALENPSFRLFRWIQQGGFAGDNLVTQPLTKFAGMTTCPSFNPGGAPKQTLALLASEKIEQRLFVSKNVCHGVVWTGALQERLKSMIFENEKTPRKGLFTLSSALDQYIRDKGTGKAMHDLVAAACAFDEQVCTFAEVDIYRERGEWGANAKEGTRTRISIGFDEDRFVTALAR